MKIGNICFENKDFYLVKSCQCKGRRSLTKHGNSRIHGGTENSGSLRKLTFFVTNKMLRTFHGNENSPRITETSVISQINTENITNYGRSYPEQIPEMDEPVSENQEELVDIAIASENDLGRNRCIYTMRVHK